MNNSKLAIDNYSLEEQEVDISPWLRERQSELVKIISAIDGVSSSKEWSSLTNLVFIGVVEKLERDLLNEAKKDTPDQLQLARLNGQLVWAKKYADLNSLANIFRNELKNVTDKLYGQTEKDNG